MAQLLKMNVVFVMVLDLIAEVVMLLNQQMVVILQLIHYIFQVLQFFIILQILKLQDFNLN